MKRFSHFYGLKAELEAFWKGFWFFEVLAVRVLTLNMKNDETFEDEKKTTKNRNFRKTLPGSIFKYFGLWNTWVALVA